MNYNGIRQQIPTVRNAWFNEEVDTTREDRRVVVWTRIHSRQTELQHMMEEVPNFEGPAKKGIATYQKRPLSAIERDD